MIFEYLLSLCKSFIITLISGIDVIKLPYEFVSFLGTVTNCGAFICGSDILLYFCTSVMFWFGVKITAGIVLFVWRLLPFT